MSEETYNKAIRAYNKLLKIYPNDRDGNFNLGLLYCYNLEQWDRAIERFEVLIQNNEQSSGPYVSQAVAYMAKGVYGEARGVLQNYHTRFPDEVWIHERISRVYLCQRRLDLARRQVEKALAIDSTSIYPSLIGDIYNYRGDVIRAENEYQKILKRKEPASQYYGRFRLAALYLSQRQFERSKEQLKQTIALAEKVRDTDQRISSHSYLAQLHFASGNPKKALEE